MADDFWDNLAELFDLLDDEDEFAGPALTDEMVRDAEADLGYTLPAAYLRLLRFQNGGALLRSCFRRPGPGPGAGKHVPVSAIAGIGGPWGIDAPDLGSRDLIREWGYPDVGVVVGHTPAAGHDAILLDYSACGPHGEPRVIHVETEGGGPDVEVLAPDFETFLRGLVSCDRHQ